MSNDEMKAKLKKTTAGVVQAATEVVEERAGCLSEAEALERLGTKVAEKLTAPATKRLRLADK